MTGQGLTTDFPLVEKGYDPNEVDRYVATQMLQLREQVDAANTRVAELESELAAVREREDAIQLTMLAATKSRDELLNEARREAFALMTETRHDVDGTIAEGRELLNDARREALNVVKDAEEETQRLMTEGAEALAKLRNEYESESATLIDRINTLRAISDDLAGNGATATPQPTPQDPPPPNEERTANAPLAGDVPDREDDDAPVADRIRGSFSGRRSVKLPRLGEEAGRNALAAATAMRAHLSHEPDDSDTTDEADLAVRTA